MLSAYYPPYRGGIENYTKNLAHALTHLNWDVEIFASAHDQPYKEKNKGVRVSCFKTNWTPLNNPISLQMIPSLFTTDYDLLFVNGFYQTIAPLGALTSALRRKPSILVIHGKPSFDAFLLRSLQLVYEGTSALLLLRMFDNIVATTNSDLEFIRTLGYPKSRIHLIPNAVETDYWRPTCESPLNPIERFEDYILFVGVLNRRKNCELLIRAFSKLHDQRQNLHLIIVGTGPFENRLRKLIEKDMIADKILFLKDISNERLRSLYQNARMLVHPSKSEGLPTVVLEAMASGTPVVVSEIPGSRDVIMDRINGFLFNQESVNDLVDAIETVLDSPNLVSQIKNRAIETIHERFSWSRIAKQMANLMRHTLP
jgi:glycosyltransferase involved in cell wall biosynthesis